MLDQDNKNKIPNDYEMLPEILDAIAFIENNRKELYIREVSMSVYHQSKYFEDNTLLHVCQILRKYKKQPDHSEEIMDEILADYGVKKEPLKYCIKGNFVLSIAGKEMDFSIIPGSFEFETLVLDVIDHITINAPNFMTIENLTSFYRYASPDTVSFYLGGYSNRFQRDFIKKVYHDNPNINYIHFGDIDAGGFWIHHNLCEITGVDFKTFCMTKDELSKKQYEQCLQPLSSNDIVRLQELKRIEIYADTIQYMLKNNVKLEQEIISLTLMQ